MTQIIEGPKRTFTAGAAIEPNRRVKLSGGKLAYAGAADTVCIGTAAGRAFVDGDEIAVRLLNAEGTHPATASEAITAGATAYAAANGKVASTGTVVAGVVLQAATADGDVIELLPAPAPILGEVARASLTEDAAQPYPLLLEHAKVWDAPQTDIPGTAASDDLAIVNNTFLTGAPTIETGDVKAGGAVSRKTRFAWTVPPEYVAGQPITLRANAGMKTTVADTSATIDFEVARRAAPSVDICATAAQSINSLTAANKDFTLTPTSIVPGDVLDIVMTVATNDAATGTAVIGKVNSVALLADIKG